MAIAPSFIPGQAQELMGPGAKAGYFELKSPQLLRVHVRTAPMNRALALQGLSTTSTVLRGSAIVRLADGTWKQAVAGAVAAPANNWQARVSSIAANNDGWGGAAHPSFTSTYYPDTQLSASLNYINAANYEAAIDSNVLSAFQSDGTTAWTPAVGDKICPASDIGGKWCKILASDSLGQIQSGTILQITTTVAVANNPANLVSVVNVLWKGSAA